MILMYPCRNGTLLNFIGFYDDSLEDAGGGLSLGGIRDGISSERAPQDGNRKDRVKIY
jgi:hypothetical protein